MAQMNGSQCRMSSFLARTADAADQSMCAMLRPSTNERLIVMTSNWADTSQRRVVGGDTQRFREPPNGLGILLARAIRKQG